MYYKLNLKLTLIEIYWYICALNILYWKAEFHLKSISVRPIRILTVNVPAKVIIVNQAKQSENLVNNVRMMMMNDMDGFVSQNPIQWDGDTLGTGVEISRSTNCDDDDEEDDVEDDNYLRMGTGVEVSRSASENCPTATPTRHNTRPWKMVMMMMMVIMVMVIMIMIMIMMIITPTRHSQCW